MNVALLVLTSSTCRVVQDFDLHGILPGESEDPPGVYLPTKAGRLTPRQTPDVFLHISLSATSCASHSAIHPRLTP